MLNRGDLLCEVVSIIEEILTCTHRDIAKFMIYLFGKTCFSPSLVGKNIFYWDEGAKLWMKGDITSIKEMVRRFNYLLYHRRYHKR